MSIKNLRPRSITSKAAAVAAALTTAGGLTAVAAQPASAATPQCVQRAHVCIEIFSKAFGTPASPNFVETVYRGIARAGVPTILAPLNTTNPAGDFLPLTGTVGTFYASGMVSAAVNAHFTGEKATQVEYAPDGVPSGLCAALATRPYENEGLSLQSCTIPGRTVWILDTQDSPGTTGYFPLVNGATTDFTHPYSMVFPGRADPAHTRFPGIRVVRLCGNPSNVPDRELWSAVPAS
jgi:hypothetical protein